MEEGTPPVKAAVAGAKEVMWPVTAAMPTTIAAFGPLLVTKGRIGDFMGELPIVVLAASRCIEGSTWEYVSSVIPMLAWPSRS